jgi:hypothetical protein
VAGNHRLGHHTLFQAPAQPATYGEIADLGAGGDIGAKVASPIPSSALDINYEDTKVLRENNLI